MDCAGLHELLDAWLSGRLGGDDAAAVRVHLDGCPECAAVVGELRGAPLTDDMVLQPVMAATSGRVCPRAQEVLAGDPEADAIERRRADEHRAHCPACARFGAVLVELEELLPTLAHRDPGPDFTAAVLLQTLPRPSLWSVFRTRLRDHIDHWRRRPDFAQEMSFALTVLLVLVTLVPGSPMQDLPRQALSLVQVVSPDEVVAAGPAPGDGTVGHRLRHGLQARGERLGDGLDRLSGHVLGAGKGLVEGDLGMVEENAGRIGCDLRRLWTGVTEPAIEPASVCG